jgi:tetratricopeptide (TPR) repeat protein
LKTPKAGSSLSALRADRGVACLALPALLALALGALGCDPTPSAEASTGVPTPAASTASPIPVAPTPNADLPEDLRTSLALVDPSGTQPVDQEVRVAQEWVRRLPKSTEKLVLLGRAWIAKARHANESGYYAHAKSAAELVLAREPESHLARELLAQVAINFHRFEEALALSEEVFTKDDESLIALAIASDSLYELGRDAEAVRLADKLVDLKPDLASYTRVAFFQWLRGDHGMALRSSKLAIEAGSDAALPEPKAYALVQTSNFFFHKGDYDGADEGYKQALKLVTDYPPALVGRARVATAKGEPQRAVEFLRVAFKQAAHADTAWRLGDALAASGDTAGAEAAYRDVLRVGTDDDKRTVSLFLSTKSRDLPLALELARDEMKLRPGLYTKDALAWALHRNGQHEEAKKLSDEARALGTKDAMLLFHAGAIRLALGDEKGRVFLQKALALNPEFDPTGAAEARALLAK